MTRSTKWMSLLAVSVALFGVMQLASAAPAERSENSLDDLNPLTIEVSNTLCAMLRSQRWRRRRRRTSHHHRHRVVVRCKWAILNSDQRHLIEKLISDEWLFCRSSTDNMTAASMMIVVGLTWRLKFCVWLVYKFAWIAVMTAGVRRILFTWFSSCKWVKKFISTTRSDLTEIEYVNHNSSAYYATIIRWIRRWDKGINLTTPFYGWLLPKVSVRRGYKWYKITVVILQRAAEVRATETWGESHLGSFGYSWR